MNDKWEELNSEWQNFSQAAKLEIIKDKEGLRRFGGLSLPRKQRVLIVGAGMAGLVAAFELMRTQCFDVTILEAQQNVGGRIRTIREPYFSYGLYGEAGAMRIPRKHKLTLAYIDRAHKDERELRDPLERFEFKNEDDEAWCYFNGRPKRWKEYKEAAERGEDCFGFELDSHELKHTIGERFEKTIIAPLREKMRDLVELQNMNEEQALNHLLLTQKPSLRDFSTRRYLKSQGWSDKAIHVYGLLENQQARMNNGVVALLREHLAGSFSGTGDQDPKDQYNLSQIRGGMDLLPKSFLKYLSKSIVFGARVNGLEKKREQATVHFSTINGGQDSSGENDYVIVTLPFPVLRHINFKSEKFNEWDVSKINAIQGLNYSESGKILFQCKERFWEKEEITGGRSQTDLAIRTVYYPTKHPEDVQERAILLVSYTWGRDSQRWTHLSHRDRVQHALKQLEKIHTVLERKQDLIEGAYSLMWQNDETSGGAFALTDPYQEEDFGKACRSADGPFHFAGEHTSLNYHRWIEGAVESGLRVAWEVYMSALRNR